ncbi:MAG: DUF4401 domain-containing protein [Saprospiraceae bacterium]
MNKEEKVKEILGQLQTKEGPNFEFNEVEILSEYQRNSGEQSSITIKILSILGGFFATLSFLGFLGITGIYSSDIGLCLFGISFIVLAIWANWKYDKLIIDTASITVFVSGFVLLALGLSEWHVNENEICFIIFGIAFSTLFFVQTYILSFTAVVFMSSTILFLISSNNLDRIVPIYIIVTELLLGFFILHEARIISINVKMNRLYNPVRLALIISVLMGLIYIGAHGILNELPSTFWIASLSSILMVLYLIALLLDLLQVKDIQNKLLFYAIGLLLMLPSFFSPSISGSLLIILLCFMVNYITGLTIGIIALIYFVSQYYYDLNFSLLIKSELLFASGFLFLFIYWLAKKNFNHVEEL